MTKRLPCIILLASFLSACAATHTKEMARQNRQSIDDAMAEAAAVTIPEVEATPVEILDDLLPGSDIVVPGLNADVGQETAFDISVSSAPARLFFMSLVQDTNTNMVVHPGVTGDISLDLKNITVSEVMQLTRDVYGYEYRQNSTGYVVLPARIQSRVFPVDYLNVSRKGESLMTVSSGQVKSSGNDDDNGDSSSGNDPDALKSSSVNTRIESDFWTQLQGTLTTIVGGGEGRSIVVDRHAGLVVVRAMPGELRDVAAYLNDAQNSLQRQVILEAKVIEVELSDSFKSGIDWAAITSSGDYAVGNTSIARGVGEVVVGDRGESAITAAGKVALSSDLDLSDIPFGNAFALGASTSNFAALITLLSTQGSVNVLSSPRISTVNNQKAVIKVGSDEFFVTDVSSDNNVTVAGTTTSPDLTLTPFFSGIALDVTPQISRAGEIILHIHPSISEVTDQTKTITLGENELQLPLAFSTVRESDSIVRAISGQVVVIGGLMKNISSNDSGGVPGIDEVPLVGELFKQKRKINRRSELVILLRPIVVDKNRTWASYIESSAKRIQGLKLPTAEGE